MKEQSYDTIIEILLEKIKDLTFWNDIYKTETTKLRTENDELKIRLGDTDDAEIL